MPVTTKDKGMKALTAAVAALVEKRVLVGVPNSTAERQPQPGEKGTPASNALIAYSMEFGVPDKNIPPRPFLYPGLEDAKADITVALIQTARAALSGNLATVERGLERVGTIGATAVKKKIMDGPFAPLSIATIEGRARRGRKGAQQFLKLNKQGVPTEVLHDAAFVKPLIDSGQLLQSITYVVRDK